MWVGGSVAKEKLLDCVHLRKNNKVTRSGGERKKRESGNDNFLQESKLRSAHRRAMRVVDKRERFLFRTSQPE